MLRWVSRVIVAPIVIAGLTAPVAAIEPLPTTPPEVQAYVDGTYGSSLQVCVFSGDFTGDGVPDAIAFIYFPFLGGNSFGLDVSLFDGHGGGLVHTRMVDDVFGMDPRDVAIEPGRISVTTTTLNPRDPRCCPTGETRFEIKP